MSENSDKSFSSSEPGASALEQSGLKRRMRTVPAVFTLAALSTVLLPAIVIFGAAFDLMRGYVRLPTARLAVFVPIWAWLEVAGVIRAFILWLKGRSGDTEAHYSLQRWWVERLMSAITSVFGLDIEVSGAEQLKNGPLVVLSRHASLADSLLTIWCLTSTHNTQPRVVLKRELLADPCLDIVGGRLPNYFVDRFATDSTPELNAIENLSVGMGSNDAAIIFPEGTRSNPAKIERALNKLRESHPARAETLSSLRHLLPPRPKGAHALIAGCPDADVVLSRHTGFEGMDTFKGVISTLGRRRVRIAIHLERVSRDEVPSQLDNFGVWLDQRWLEMDQAVDEHLTS